MGAFEAVCIILRALAKEIHERKEKTVGNDFILVYQECEDLVNETLNEFINGAVEGAENR